MPELKPRWKRCVESTDQLLGEALGQKYVEKYFPPEAKARMQDMVKNLLAAMTLRPGLAAADVMLAVTTFGFDIAGLELWLPLLTGARLVMAGRGTASSPDALAAESE